ncbi:hypothetical protein AGR5A_Lc10134 [Agrobacterium genomosp. 5 str. CFBP 6626]|nr:hypothetical protein AGR5A_Lc10134 [Agrobacterium genomosp. 5 str. CFBP 6626]
MEKRAMRNHSSPLASDAPVPKTKKPAAGEGAAGFSKTRTTAGRRSAIVHEITLGRRIGSPQFEALREEVHHFDEDHDTRFRRILNRLYRSAAMQETQGLICTSDIFQGKWLAPPVSVRISRWPSG